jgi:hypothetical protein
MTTSGGGSLSTQSTRKYLINSHSTLTLKYKLNTFGGNLDMNLIDDWTKIIIDNLTTVILFWLTNKDNRFLHLKMVIQ